MAAVVVMLAVAARGHGDLARARRSVARPRLWRDRAGEAHLLVPARRSASINLVMSIQAGGPALASILPRASSYRPWIAVGWRAALAAQIRMLARSARRRWNSRGAPETSTGITFIAVRRRARATPTPGGKTPTSGG